VINVSGHRIGTAEVESALVLHDSVAEAAVVGYPHDLKGQGVYAFVTPMNGVTPDDTLKAELLALVSKEIGSFAKPELIQWAPACPRPARARSCGVYCARSPATNWTAWAIPRPWPTRAWYRA
jgi:acetyl-CoA synthetase